jgi:hypothetical protein
VLSAADMVYSPSASATQTGFVSVTTG